MREEFAAPLAPLTTLRVGGPAHRLVTVHTTDELVDAVREVDDAGEPLLVLGGGSNVVIADAGFAGTVVKVASTGVTRESQDACGGAFVRVAAGHDWDELVAESVSQNVGAYGQEVAQTIARVRTWDRQEARVATFSASECGFTYRHSRFKGSNRYVVLDVAFQFVVADLSRPIAYADLAAGLGVAPGTRVPLAEARAAVLEQRRRRGMVVDPADHDTWSCGSFFTNPLLTAEAFERLRERVHSRLGAEVSPPRYPAADGVKTSAAWLIEKAGYAKGYNLPGPAALSTKHTLAVTNRGGASAAQIAGLATDDVRGTGTTGYRIAALAREIRDGVHAAFGVTLVNEPVFVGHDL